jgi:hypothetical protein
MAVWSIRRRKFVILETADGSVNLKDSDTDIGDSSNPVLTQGLDQRFRSYLLLLQILLEDFSVTDKDGWGTFNDLSRFLVLPDKLGYRRIDEQKCHSRDDPARDGGIGTRHCVLNGV